MEIIKREQAAEFDAFVKSHYKASFMQGSPWAGVKKNWQWRGVISRGEDGKIDGTMALLIRKVPGMPYSLMYSPRGPVCDPHDRAMVKKLVDAAVEVGKEFNAYVLTMDTDIKVEDTEFANLVKSLGFPVDSTTQSFETIQPRFVFRLDVEGKTEDEVFGAFASKHRYNIRVAKKKGVEVKICGPEAAEDFHKIMIETGKRDDFGIRSTEYFRSILENFGEDARIYLAYYEGQPIAGSLAIHYGDKVWYLYGASSNEHRNVMPNYLVQWEMIRWAIETGCRIYDFRGVSGYLDESNPLYGIYRFKKGFSGELTEFIGEMNLVIKPFAFQLVTCGEKVYKKLRTVKRKLAEKK